MKRLLSIAFVLAFSIPAQALTVRPPSFSELVGTSDAIVIGEVTSVTTNLRTVTGRPVPFTHVTIAVTETLKGPATKTVVLQCLGGTVGSQSLQVVGVPQFAVGERGFYFVQNNGRQFFPLVAVGHGLYRLLHDRASGADYIARADGAPLRSIADVGIPLAHAAAAAATAASASRGLTPAEFARQIRTEVAHAR